MQVPHPLINIRARELFRRIYTNRRVDVKASKKSLEAQLELYLDHIGAHVGHTISKRERTRIWSILERNNHVARILETPNYRRIVKRKKQLLGDVILGYVFCIDGRIPAIFVGGRFARHFEIPAAEITNIKRKSDNKLIPDSTDLNESLRKAASTGIDLFEIVAAHTSFLDPHHGCGAMAAKRKNGELDEKLTNEDANLKIIEEKTIPSITNIYNEFREQMGLEPLKRVGISAVYDTDSFGIILNHNLRDKEETLSTTNLTQKYKDQFDELFIKNNLVFGSFRDKFSDLKFLPAFSANILTVTQSILDSKASPEIIESINDYIEKHYSDLTKAQKQALKFVLVRNIAFQYLTGLSSVRKKNLDHPFAEHEESFMAVAMRGGTIGKFDPENQCFASTPADPKSAISNIITMLSILGDSPKIKPYILFVCNSITERELGKDDEVTQRLMGSNAGLLRDIIADKTLGKMIETGEIIPVPVLVEEDSREVLRIIDHSAYI